MPGAPRTDPSVQFSRTGLFRDTSLPQSEYFPTSLLPSGRLALFLRHGRPDNVSFEGYVSCQPLPHVAGFPDFGVLWVDPTSYRPSAVLLWVGLAYLLMDESVEEELIGDPTFLTPLCTLATL